MYFCVCIYLKTHSSFNILHFHSFEAYYVFALFSVVALFAVSQSEPFKPSLRKNETVINMTSVIYR